MFSTRHKVLSAGNHSIGTYWWVPTHTTPRFSRAKKNAVERTPQGFMDILDPVRFQICIDVGSIEGMLGERMQEGLSFR